jgi:glucose-1-phosphate thymidylyltransferase
VPTAGTVENQRYPEDRRRVEMTKQWLRYPNLKCVMLCAGRGRRLLSYADGIPNDDMPKVLHLVNGEPILHYVVDYWRQYTRDFVFVVHYKKQDVIDFVRGLPVSSVCVEQRELRGIANALTYAAPHVGERFILVLGDCVCDGLFSFPEGMQQGVGIWETEDSGAIKRSYSVEIDSDTALVRKVVEKPKFLPNKWCGLGYYFFDRRVFHYIQRTPPSSLRGEVEITNVIQSMIDGGERISAVPYQGNYINITFPEDIHRAKAIFSPHRRSGGEL